MEPEGSIPHSKAPATSQSWDRAIHSRPLRALTDDNPVFCIIPCVNFSFTYEVTDLWWTNVVRVPVEVHSGKCQH